MTALQPRQSSVTAVLEGIVQSSGFSPDLDMGLQSMLSTSVPSTAASIFIPSNVNKDMDMDVDPGTSFGPSEEIALNLPARSEAEDGVALGDQIMEP